MGELIPTGELAAGTPALDTCAKYANENARRWFESGVATLAYAVATGEWLLRAKEQIAHGEWLSWVEDNFCQSARTAQISMRICRNQPALESAGVQTMQGAMEFLANPKAADPEDGPNAQESLRICEPQEEEERGDWDGEEVEYVTEEDDEPETVTIPNEVTVHDVEPDGTVEGEEEEDDEDEDLPPWVEKQAENDAALEDVLAVLRSARKFIPPEGVSPWIDMYRKVGRTNLNAAIKTFESMQGAGVCGKCDGEGCGFCHEAGFMDRNTVQ